MKANTEGSTFSYTNLITLKKAIAYNEITDSVEWFGRVFSVKRESIDRGDPLRCRDQIVEIVQGLRKLMFAERGEARPTITLLYL